MPRTIPLSQLRDPDPPNPYEHYQKERAGPTYDLLVVGRGVRHAYRGGLLVDEVTGEPLSGPPAPPTPDDAPPKKRRGRPRKQP